MDLCSESCLSGQQASQSASWPSILCNKSFNTGHYTQTVPPNFFVHAMLIGTIDFYHFIPCPLTLTLPGIHKISTKQSIGFIFSHTFQLIRMKFDVVMKQFMLNILRLCLSSIYKNKVNKLLLTVPKNFNIGMQSYVYESVWFKLDVVIDTCAKLILHRWYSRERTLLTWFYEIHTFNIVVCQDTYELICFKLGMMLNTTKLYRLISVWMTLVFTQG